MTVNEFYSFSIRPRGLCRDFSHKEKLIGDLSEYCINLQYIEVHMNEVEAYQKAELKIEIDEENLDNVREILKPFGLEKQLLD